MGVKMNTSADHRDEKITTKHEQRNCRVSVYRSHSISPLPTPKHIDWRLLEECYFKNDYIYPAYIRYVIRRILQKADKLR